MGILLVRHAEAVPEQSGLDDAARWLSELGRAQARTVAQAVRAEGLVLARMFASPRVRAMQTAELFAAVLGFQGEVESLPSLSYTAPAELAARELSAYDHGQPIAAFGHMPTIAEIAARLTGGGHGGAGLGLSEAIWIEDNRVVWSHKPRQ